MQNKGFVTVFAALLALVCAFYISFSFVTNRYEKKAEEYALQSGNPAKHYLDSISTEKVWFGYTYKQAQEMQIGLGLDLKGGMNVILEISVADVLKSLAAENAGNPTFTAALKATQDAEVTSGADFMNLFAKNFKQIDPTANLADVFSTYQLKEKIKKDTPDSEVLSILKKEMDDALSNSFQVLRNRIDRFGVVAPNIQRLEQAGRILVELPGIKEPERVKKLLQGSANLEFWETFSLTELYPSFARANQLLASQSKGEAQNSEADSNAADEDEAAATSTEVSDSNAEQEPAVVADTTQNIADSLANAQAAQAADQEAQLAEFRANNPLFAKLQLYVNEAGQAIDGPVVGYAAASDTAAINAMLAQKQIRDLFNRKLRFAWGVKSMDPKGIFYQLYALKAHDNAGHPSLPDASKGGDIVVDARADFQQFSNQFEVSMEMTPEAGTIWAKLTKENIGKCVAIVLDGVVYSAPRVNSEISGGRSSITGNFDAEEANDLANVLKSGKMAAQVNIVSEDVVGPTLGQEAIRASVISFIIALILLFIYMVAFYGAKAGLVADVCLIINAFFTVGILSSFNAVLTLSGIAGLVLSMGIAVDANVLIYERAKEELAGGKALRSAVTAAYSNAFSAIFDANLTSLITGIILYIFGTGPIQGFAVTFIIGIITSFISAVFLSRIYLESALEKGWIKSLTFTGFATNWIKPTRIDFVKKGMTSRVVYAVLAVISVVLLFWPGMRKGIDFTGGRNYIVNFADVEKVETEPLTKALQSRFGDATVSVITINASNENEVRISTNYALNSTKAEDDENIKHMIYDAGVECNYIPNSVDFDSFNNETYIPSTQKVGPSVADDITVGAIWAIIVSLIAIALYILFRFRDIAFSIGSIFGLAANTLFILGLYAILWTIMPFSMEIDQAFIAAILTVIGYSINDIVVVFDRIREVRTLYPTKSLYEVINEALNATMVRTINTSVSTLLVLLVIFFLGGTSIQSFIFAMILGVVIDPLTTIFLAVPTAYLFMHRKEKKKVTA
jgi:SecD/SecF fusion protein